MASMRIISMNQVIGQFELAQTAPLASNREQLHYWHIQRKTKKGWRFVCEFTGTKHEAADYFCKWFRESERGTFRLKHQVAY